MSCPSTQVYHDLGFIAEVWAWFVLGTIALTARYAVRLRIVGWRGLQGDDYMAIVVLLCFLCDSITVTLTYYWGTNVDFTEDEIAAMTQCQIKKIRLGSRMQLLAWYTYTLLIWALKSMMLFFFNRIVFGLDQQRLVKLFAVICGATYVAVFMTISCGCYPIALNWKTRPKPPERCTLRLQNFYVTTILNVLTDAAILTVPLPLLWQLRVSIRRKIALTLLLCSGIFVITAAIIRIVMTLRANPSAVTINLWGTRETILGIFAVNAPILKPLFYRSFWRRGFDPSKRGPSPTPPHHQSPAMAIDKSPRAETKIDCIAMPLENQEGMAQDCIKTGTKSGCDFERPRTDSVLGSRTYDDIELGQHMALVHGPGGVSMPRPLLPEPALVWPTESRPLRGGVLPSIDEEVDDISYRG